MNLLYSLVERQKRREYVSNECYSTILFIFNRKLKKSRVHLLIFIISFWLTQPEKIDLNSEMSPKDLMAKQN